MIRTAFWPCVVLPLVTFAVYLVLQQHFLPARFYDAVYSENGLFELGTAVFFAVTSVAAVRLYLKTRSFLPRVYRAFYIALAAGCLFVAFEELSYGQHLLGLNSPAWFSQNNAKAELNLHNLFENEPSKALRRAATVVFPVAFVVLPLALASRRYRLSDWYYYVLPQKELITTMLVAQACTSLDDLSKSVLDAGLFVRPGEVQEFHWGLAMVMYVAILSRRVIPTVQKETHQRGEPLRNVRAKAA